MDEIGTPRPWWRRRRLQVTLAVITGIVVVLAAAGITGYVLWPHSSASQTRTGQPAPPSGQTAQPAPPPGQTVLPFTGLDEPGGVAVDGAGNLYVTESFTVGTPSAPHFVDSRVVKLAAG